MKKHILIASLAVIGIVSLSGGIVLANRSTPSLKPVSNTTVKTPASTPVTTQQTNTPLAQEQAATPTNAPATTTPEDLTEPPTPETACTTDDQSALVAYEDDLSRLKDGYTNGTTSGAYYTYQSHILGVNIQSETDKGCTAN